MSFLIDHYYLIEPRPQLAERVRTTLDANFASVVLERVVVAKEHNGPHVVDDAHAVTLKLAFLSLLRVDRIWDTPTQFEEQFGSARLSVDLFDRWWTLAAIECARFEEWERFVGPASPFISPPPDPRVARWLSERRNRDESDAAPDPTHHTGEGNS